MNLNYFRDHIKAELKQEGLTLNSLSQKADLSEDTLRSLIYGKTQDVKLSTISRIADVLHCSIDHLIGRYDWFYNEPLLKKIQCLSPRSLQTIQTLITLELNSTQRTGNSGSHTIPLLIPTGNMKEGCYYDNAIFRTFDLSDYPAHLQSIINMGLLMNSNHYEPFFFENDILLLSTEKKPEFNDIVLYQSKEGRLYIRRISPSGLEPIDQFGETLSAHLQKEMTPIGILVKTAKEFNIEQYR